MTPAQADKAIKSGKPITVKPLYETPFVITLTARDRRCVEGTYQCDGKTYTGKFERADLTLISQ